MDLLHLSSFFGGYFFINRDSNKNHYKTSIVITKCKMSLLYIFEFVEMISRRDA